MVFEQHKLHASFFVIIIAPINSLKYELDFKEFITDFL